MCVVFDKFVHEHFHNKVGHPELSDSLCFFGLAELDLVLCSHVVKWRSCARFECLQRCCDTIPEDSTTMLAHDIGLASADNRALLWSLQGGAKFQCKTKVVALHHHRQPCTKLSGQRYQVGIAGVAHLPRVTAQGEQAQKVSACLGANVPTQ